MNRSNPKYGPFARNAILALLITATLNFSLSYVYGNQPADTSEFAMMKTVFDAVKSGLIMILSALIVLSVSGLVKKKKWGYILAIISLIIQFPVLMFTNIEMVITTDFGKSTMFLLKLTFPIISLGLLYLSRKDFKQ